jgi:chemotaxis response regulator CheB
MNTLPQIRVFSVDDHPIMREGIAAIIHNEPDMLMVAEASNGREAVLKFREQRPDVTTSAASMP